MKAFDPVDLDRLLDEVQPPPLSPDFAARIADAAVAMPQGDTPRTARDRRGPWARPHRTLASFVAANLLVASAVAAAIVGGQGIEPLRKVPLIAPVIERISPRHAPKMQVAVSHPHTAPRSVQTAPPPPASSPQPAEVATPQPEPLLARDQPLAARHAALAAAVQRREAAGLPVPARLQRRFEAQNLRRQALEHRMAGQPVPPALRRQIARSRLAMSPPAVRRNLHEAIRERRAIGEPVPPLVRAAEPPYAAPDEAGFPSFQEWAAERRERTRRYLEGLTPEQRREIRREQREDQRRRFEQDDGPPD